MANSSISSNEEMNIARSGVSSPADFQSSTSEYSLHSRGRAGAKLRSRSEPRDFKYNSNKYEFFDKLTKVVRNDNEILKEKIKMCEEEAEVNETALCTVMDKLRTVEIESESLKQELSNLKNKLDESEATRIMLEEGVVEKSKRLDEVQENLDLMVLKTVNKTLMGGSNVLVDDLKTQLEENKFTIACLQQQITDKSYRVNAILAREGNLLDRLNDLKRPREQEKLKAKVKELKHMVKNLQVDKEELKRKVRELDMKQEKVKDKQEKKKNKSKK